MGVGERGQSPSGRGKKYPGFPGEMSHSVPIQVLRGQGKLQIFQIIYRKGLSQICRLLLPTQGESNGETDLRKALCTNHQHQKSVTAIWENVLKATFLPRGPDCAQLTKTYKGAAQCRPRNRMPLAPWIIKMKPTEGTINPCLLFSKPCPGTCDHMGNSSNR